MPVKWPQLRFKFIGHLRRITHCAIRFDLRHIAHAGDDGRHSSRLQRKFQCSRRHVLRLIAQRFANFLNALHCARQAIAGEVTIAEVALFEFCIRIPLAG